MASGGENDRAPRMNITVETAQSVYFTWRPPKVFVPLTPAEKAAERIEYYKAYDPLTGLKIAATLSGLLTMAVLYVFYKAKCKRMKFLRGSSFEDSINVDQQMSWASGAQHARESNAALHNSTSLYQVEVDGYGSSNKLSHHSANCESGRDTPASSITTQQPALHHQSTVTIKSSSHPHYYTDDSEMPAWKIYAKELFLYGGPGLWRSASLKGSDPVLLVAQSSFDETINTRSQRTGSLSGSVMGGLGIYRCDSSRKPSCNSQSRLQVPCVGNKACVPQQLHRQRSLNRNEMFRPDEKLVVSCEQQQLSPFSNKKNLPGRSVSFRESDMTNYSRCKRVARSRPGSLRNSRPDYSRLRSGSCSNADSSHLRPDSLLQPTATRRSSFRTPSRQTSIRESRLANRSAAASASVDIPSLPPTSPHSRSVVVHRIPIHLQQLQQEDSKKSPLYGRSASLSSEPITRGWRSSIAKMIRAKSTSGNSVSRSNAAVDCSSPKSRRARPPSSLALESAQTSDDGDNSHHSSQTSNALNDNYEGHIDICVIQATPAASPCASIRSTLSGDSLEMATIKNIPPYAPTKPPSNMSVRDRRKCFARMKGQTIDHDHTEGLLTIDTSFLAPPAIEYSGGGGLNPSSLLAHPMADFRSRSTSPARHPATTWLQVFQNSEPNPKANCQQPAKKSPHSVASGGKSPVMPPTASELSQQLLPTTAVAKTRRPASQQSPTNTQQQCTQFPF